MPTTSESRLIAASVAEVWAAITDLEAASRWNQAWQRVEYLSWQREGVDTTFRSHTEDDRSFDFRISEWAPEEYVAFEPLREEPEERRYLITLESQSFLLEAVSHDHTNVTLIASATGHGLRGWLAARFVWPGHQRELILRPALDALQALFEPPDGPEQSGETSPRD
ncbi:MAG: SRPBCC family protein [Dehalococcoidia bacterium]|nr:MAG: SRPBCC family protein [Dehalococcoidia bacterium]